MLKLKVELARIAAIAAFVMAPALLAGQTRPIPAAALADLVTALKQTSGCLGVDTARTSSGKQVIFAWFADKKAAMTWYYSDAHVAAMHAIGGSPSAQPMEHVPDGTPVLAIASLTQGGAQGSTAAASGQAGSAASISQIAIELYAPLPGGIAVGGRFAPTTLNVPGLRDLPITMIGGSK